MNEQYKQYRRRFIIVFLFMLAQFTISILLNTLTPIAYYLVKIYDLNGIVIILGGLLFILMHPIFTFPAAYVIDTYGTRTGISIGSVLALIGVSLRLGVNNSFGWVIAGQVIAGISRPFILNCQAKISANWFSAESRGGVTQLLTLVLNVSMIIGFFIPTLVFGKYQPNNENPQSIAEGKDTTFKLMLIQMIIAFVCLVPNIILQRSSPPTPSSAAGSIKRQQFKQAMSQIIRNKNFILLLAIFFLYFGVFNGLSMNLSFMVEPFFGKESLPFVVSVIGGSPVISGIIGVIVLGSMQRKSGVFKKWIVICMSGSLILMSLFYPMLLSQSILIVSLSSALNSFFLIPLVPIILQLGCEIVFPVGQGSAVGLLFACGNLGGFALGLIIASIMGEIQRARSGGAIAFCVGVELIGLILTTFLKQQKNRQKAESMESEKRKSTLSQSTVDQAKKQIRISLMDKSSSKPPQRQLFTQGYVKLKEDRQQNNMLV